MAQKKTSKSYSPTFVRAWRKYRGVTLEQLAASVGSTNPTLSRLETGKHPYGQELLEKIAVALKVDVASLLTRDPYAPTPIWEARDRVDAAKWNEIERVVEAMVGSAKSVS